MSFGKIFSDSWNEYWNNFKAILVLFLLLFVLPQLILTAYGFYSLYNAGFFDAVNAGALSQLVSGVTDPSIISQGLITEVGKISMIQGLISLVLAFVTYLLFVSLSSVSLQKNEYSSREALREGSKNYWKTLGFVIVTAIFLGLLYLAFIIPGVIFTVYWVFAYFVFINEKRGIISSLKRSFHMVRGKWWKTFGYIILITLITVGISFLFSIPSIIHSVLTLGTLLSGGATTSTFLVGQIIKFVFSMIGALITLPLTILFFKNFYLFAIKAR